MEFAELIKISRVDNVRMRRPVKAAMEVTAAVTGHHLILSATEEESSLTLDREIWLLHRNIHTIGKEADTSRSGTICLKYKDLRTFYLDIIGPDKLQALTTTLELLSGVQEATSAYPFFYSPGFKALEDGWHLFRPEEEYGKIVKSGEAAWRVSRANQEYGLCPTYGRLLLVPAAITDAQALNCAKHRQGGRFPHLAYLHRADQPHPPAAAATAAVPLVRASHTVAGWRNGDDEKLMAAILGHFRKGFIISVTSDKAGSKPEFEASYHHWKRVNMKLASTRDLTESLASLSVACNDPVNEKWLSKLAAARWLTHVKDVLNAACLVAQCLEKEVAPVLVFEQESQDLALVITSLTQIILNPDSRTLHGFEALVEREWIQGGHPFWTRHSPQVNISASSGESAPVFLLFLDCVHQIYAQFPCSFEFTEKLLVFLADHSCASPFGTFLCNSEKERGEAGVREHTVSLWSYLNQVEILSTHLNCVYLPNKAVIWPSVASMSILLWAGYFLRWVQDQSSHHWERKKMSEIMERNKEAKLAALRLRRELKELQEEAIALGVLKNEDQTEDESGSRKDSLRSAEF